MRKGVIYIVESVHIKTSIFEGVYSQFLVKCQNSFKLLELCINNTFTIFLLSKSLPCCEIKTFNQPTQHMCFVLVVPASLYHMTFETSHYDVIHKKLLQNTTRPIASENRCKLYPPERKLTKAIQTSLNLEGEDQGEI